MSKLTLNDLTSLENSSSAVTTINNNSAAIVTALENTLSRDGTAPNSMAASLDMNSNRILNLPLPINSDEPVRLFDLQNAELSASSTVGVGKIYEGTNGHVLYDNNGVLGEYDITGTGSVALSNSPTLVTPNLGAASATSVNKVTITPPATGATLTVANGVTATFPSTDTYVGRTTTDTLTNKTLTSPVINGTATGTAIGTTANKLVKLDATGKLPAVDGSQLTNLPGGGSGGSAVSTRTALAGTATSANIVILYETGREGIFKWSSSNHSTEVTADPQQGVYVAPTSDTTGASGAWVRVMESPGLYNIEWFGASTSLADNGPAIQAALSFAGSQKGGIFVPAGTFTYSSVLSLTTFNTGIFGTGKDSNLQYTGTSIGLSVYSNEMVTLRDLQLSATQNTAIILQLSTFSSGFMSNNVFYVGGGEQVQLTSATLTTGGSYGIHFIGGATRNAATVFLGLDPQSASVGLTQAIYIIGMEADGFQQFLRILGAGNGVFVSQCRIERHISSTTPIFNIGYTDKFVIRDCYIEDNGDIPIVSVTANCGNITLSDNFLAPNVDGGTHLNSSVMFTNGFTVSAITLHNNYISFGGTVSALFSTGSNVITAINTVFLGGTADWGFAGSAATNDTNILVAVNAGAVFNSGIRQVVGRFT